jgi:hypothetical protein
MISFPKDKQKKLGLHPGDFVEVSLDVPENKNQHRISAMGKFAGILSTEEFMREKQKEIDLEEKKFQHWNKGSQEK